MYKKYKSAAQKHVYRVPVLKLVEICKRLQCIINSGWTKSVGTQPVVTAYLHITMGMFISKSVVFRINKVFLYKVEEGGGQGSSSWSGSGSRPESDPQQDPCPSCT